MQPKSTLMRWKWSLLAQQGPEFESSFEHATTLKLLGRVCRSFGSHKTWEISICSCTQRISDLHHINVLIAKWK